jgi:hypothetical protein
MLKWLRNYQLFIEANPNLNNDSASLPLSINNKETTYKVGDIIEISYPLTIEFSINKTMSSGANMMNLRIYNLAEKTRAQLMQDPYNMVDFGSGKRYRKVILNAGYGKNIPTLFVGNMTNAYSYRQGVDVITEITAFDGMYGQLNSQTSKTFAAGTAKTTVLDSLYADLIKVNKGITTDIGSDVLKRGLIADGNTFNIIKENFGEGSFNNNGTQSSITTRQIFIDNEQINLIAWNDYIDTGSVYVINSDTGLLGTPIRRETSLECEILFEPSLILAQLVELKSTINKNFNGAYQVWSIRHDCTISGAESGNATTHLQLYIGSHLLNGLRKL